MTNKNEPVSLGMVGVGGYAKLVTDVTLDHGPRCDPPLELKAACDPALADFAERTEALHSRGVETLTDYEGLLARSDIDALWLPIPISLHRSFTERAFAAGKAVLCEKPLAGAVQDIDAMIGARDAAAGGKGLPAAVGFHDTYAPETLQLKRRLKAGQWGDIQSVTVHAAHPRSDIYFRRNDWAGAIQRNGQWVLDSPANNAAAHFINLPLFLLGPTEQTSAKPVAIEAELYRAADIENYDTISMRLTLDTGHTLLVLMTHACSRTRHAVVHFRGDRGSVRFAQNPRQAREQYGEEAQLVEATDARAHMVERFARQVRGIEDADRAVSTFEAARQHTLAINGASAASPIVEVPESAIEPTTIGKEEGTVQAIAGINSVIDDCAKRELMLHESDQLPFTQPPGKLDLTGYDYFAGPKGVTPRVAS